MNSSVRLITSRIIWIVTAIVIISIITVPLLLLRKPDIEELELTKLQEQRSAVQTMMQSSYAKVLFSSVPLGNEVSNEVLPTISLHLANANDAETNGETTVFTENTGTFYSNVLEQDLIWYSIQDNQLTRYSNGEATLIGAIAYTPKQLSQDDRRVIAVNPANTWLAWPSEENNLPTIVGYDLTSNQERIITSGEPYDHFSSLTWSPHNDEVAAIDYIGHIATFTTDGAELYNEISIQDTEFNNLTWIEPDVIATVQTSTSENSMPFDPRIVLVNRQGSIIEQHTLPERIGIPRILWSPDTRNFLFYNPWQNQFMVFDRFDDLLAVLDVRATGTVQPEMWFSGELPAKNTRVNEINAQILEEANGTTVTTSITPFEVTAAEWDSYNETVRNILGQFKVDFATYQFAVGTSGVSMNYAFTAEQTNAQHAIVQTALQTLFTLPEVPAIALTATLANGNTVIIDSLTRETATAVVDTFTERSFDQLFIVNAEHPFGWPTPKQNQPKYNYVGDLVYDTTGKYNPNPVLAFLEARTNQYVFLKQDRYSLSHDVNWLIKDLYAANTVQFAPGDIVLYDAATDFISDSEWNGYSIELRNYQIPAEITVEQWITVNRSDRTYEDIPFALTNGLTGKRLIDVTSNTIEYILKGESTVYVFVMRAPQPLTDAQTSEMDHVIESFSLLSFFQR